MQILMHDKLTMAVQRTSGFPLASCHQLVAGNEMNNVG